MLYIKKEKVLDKKALKGAADNGTDPVYKDIRPVKLDFSATNFKSKVMGWRISIENKVDALFPAVCNTARGIAGIAAAVDSTQQEHHDPQILARANLASDDEDSAMDEEDNIQAIDEDHGDKFDEHHDKGGDNDHRDNSRVDEDHNDGGDDSDGHDNEGDDPNGHDNEGDKGISSEDDEDNSKASLSYRGPNGNGDNDDNGDNENDNNDETKEKNYVEGAEGSDLTEIGSSSDVSIVEVAPASGSRRKGIQRGRR